MNSFRHEVTSLTSLELFFDSRDWLQRNWGFLSKSLTKSRLWAFCGFSSLVSLSIIWASKSWRSGGRLFSSSEGSLLLRGLTIASGFALIVATKPSVVRTVNSPVVSRFSSTISSKWKGTAGILSIECHSRVTRRIFTFFYFVMQIMSNFSQGPE